MRAYSASRSSSSTSRPSAAATAPQRQVDLDGLLRLHLQALDERRRVLAGGLQPLVDRDALRLELLHGVLHTRLQVGLHHRLRRLDVDQLGQRRRGALDELVAGLVELARADALGQRGAPLLDRVELAEVLADPFVGQLGQHRLLHLGDVDLEVGRLAGAVRRGGEGQLVADVGAEQLGVEAGGHPAVADLVQPVLGVQPGDRLAVAGAGEVEGDLVAGLHRPVDVDQRTLPAQLGLDGLVDVGFGGRRRRQLDAQPAVAGHRDLGPHLAGGVERDRAGFLAAGELDVAAWR